jgi:hypothetical protein
MSRVFLKFLLMMLPIGLFLAWFEVARGGRESNLFLIKRRLLEAAAPRAEVLFLGSSHVHEGIVPGLVHSNAFNLSAVSQSLYYDAALTRKYLPILPKLKLVVMAVSYHSMEYEVDRSAEDWRTFYYRHYHGIPHRDWRMETKLRNWSSWFLFGADQGLDAIRGTKPEIIRNNYDALGAVVDTRPEGDRTLHLAPDAVVTSAPVSFDRHKSLMHPEEIEFHRQDLRRLLPQLRDRGIRVALIRLPVSAGYKERELASDWARSKAVIEELHRDFGVTWNDYSADARFTEADFWNADHLNFPGAEKFSRILGEEVVRPMLTGAAPR